MRIRLVVAALLTMAAILAWGAGASTQTGTSSGGAASGDSADVPRLLDERVQIQQQVQQAQLFEHREMVVDLMERVEQASLDHHARTARQLGDRAPTETVPPMATIPPMETASPADD